LAPEIAIHQARDLVEPELAGDWRGIYNHKAAAASVMALFVYFGWFAALQGRPFAGAMIASFAFGFLIFTGGKSELALLLVASFVAFFVTRSRSLWMKYIIALAPLSALAFLTIGSVIFEPARDVLRALSIDPTFTGRAEIWRFAFDAISRSPWTGHGYEAFWYSEGLRHGFDNKTRWMAGVATSHNSYVDLALTIGIPGLALALIVLVIVPLRDFHRTLPTRENVALSRFFLILWLFALYLGSFEAFFFSRASPIWFTFAMALCGLRSTALFSASE
jgi:O-antigen ligase